jgi:hypothetical protein
MYVCESGSFLVGGKIGIPNATARGVEEVPTFLLAEGLPKARFSRSTQNWFTRANSSRHAFNPRTLT